MKNASTSGLVRYFDIFKQKEKTTTIENNDQVQAHEDNHKDNDKQKDKSEKKEKDKHNSS